MFAGLFGDHIGVELDQESLAELSALPRTRVEADPREEGRSGPFRFDLALGA